MGDAATVDARLADHSSFAVTFSFEYEAPPFILTRPEMYRALLLLDSPLPSEGRVAGVMGTVQGSGTQTDEVSGEVEDEVIHLEPGRVRDRIGGTFEWESLTLSLRSGQGTAEGTWSRSRGDVTDMSPVTATIAVAADADPAGAWFVHPQTRATDGLLPVDLLAIRFDEPISQEFADQMRILADGSPVEGRLQGDDSSDLLAELVFVPDELLPFSTELSLDTRLMRDTSGNSVEWTGDPLRTAEDPGALLSNPSFEAGLSGWFSGSGTGVVGEYEGILPVGDSQVVVREKSSLGGYFDVPLDAEELTFTASLFSEVGDTDPNHTAVISLYADPSDRTTIIDFHDRVGEGVVGDFGEFRHRIGPLDVTVDLAPYRGRRVFISADVRSSFFIGANFFALILDDFEVH